MFFNTMAYFSLEYLPPIIPIDDDESSESGEGTENDLDTTSGDRSQSDGSEPLQDQPDSDASELEHVTTNKLQERLAFEV